MNETILAVDDQTEVLRQIDMMLRFEGFQVRRANDGIEALEILNSEPVDLILADVAMPRMNGYQLYERVRQHPDWTTIPFLFLTARGMDSDIRFGKELGVDDYLVKPITNEDLLASIRGKLRRARQVALHTGVLPEGSGDDNLSYEHLKLSPRSHQAWIDDTVLQLSAREFKLLQTLMSDPATVHEPQDLIEATHGYKLAPDEASDLLRPLVRTLRRKLATADGESLDYIVTVRGVGYRLRLPGEIG